MFRSLVSIQGPEGYGPSTLPLRHSENIADKYAYFAIDECHVHTIRGCHIANIFMLEFRAQPSAFKDLYL